MGAVSPDRQFKVIFVVVQSLSHVDSFATPQTVALDSSNSECHVCALYHGLIYLNKAVRH